MIRPALAVAVLVCGALLSSLAQAAQNYQQKTADFLTRCVTQDELCGDMLNEELKTLSAQAAIGRAKDICAPLPLSKEQSDQMLLWMLSNAQQMNGFAADDIGLAARTLWLCK
jgi:hypothetical protein